jgi:hypothetical protein
VILGIALLHAQTRNLLEAFRLRICFLLKGCEFDLGLRIILIFSSNTCTSGGRVERHGQLRAKVPKSTGHLEAAIFGSFWHHFHMFLPECCMDFFLYCAHPNHIHKATQGAQKQLKPWSIALNQ